jgi:23S rRNA pseudouridine1911/1915/1917 synthase
MILGNKKFIKIIAENIENKKRIDSFLSEKIELLTRTKIQDLIKNHKVFIINSNKEENIVLNSNLIVKKNDTFLVNLEGCEGKKSNEIIVAKDIPIEILYEDKFLIVINKQPFLTVHPGAGNYDNTLVNALIHHFGKDNLSNVNGNLRPGIVHRLDKDTSGVMVIAKNDITHAMLAKQFEEHSIIRKYRALVFGNIKIKSMYLENYLIRSEKNRLRYEVSKMNKGKLAKTKITSLISYKNLISLLEFELLTGRTHQIRVHSSYLKMPILGDKVYYDNNVCNNIMGKIDNDSIKESIKTIDRQLLNAFYLEFIHPNTNKKLIFNIKDYPDMVNFYKIIGFDDFI